MGVPDWYPPAGSVAVWGRGDGSEKEQWPLPTFMSGRKLSPSSCPDARHFSSSLYDTGAFQAATLVLELRGSKSESVCRAFKRNFLGIQQFLPLTQSLLVFIARSYGDLPSLHWYPGVGLGLLAPKISLPNFYSPYVGCGTACSASRALLPVWNGCGFFNSIVVRLPFNLFSDVSE